MPSIDTEPAPSEPGALNAAEATRRALGASFAASALILLLNAGSGVLLARVLGPTTRGVLAAALLWPTISAAVGTLGLMEASTFYAARRGVPPGALLGSGLALGAGQGLLFTALCAAVLPLVLHAHPGALSAAYAYLAFIPINITTLQLSGVLNGQHRYAQFQAVRLLVIAATVASLGGLAAAGTLTVTHAVLAYLAANALTLAVTARLALRGAQRPQVDRGVARALLSYGIRSHSSTVSSQLNERLDQLVISIFLASRSLGLYVIAVTMTSVTYLVGTSIAWVALPQLAAVAPDNHRAAQARRTIRLTLGLSIVVSVPVLVLARPLVRLFFGAGFTGATNIVRVLVVAVILLGTNRVLEAILRALGRPLDAGVAELIALAATVAGLAVLLPLLGLIGAAWASLLAYGVSTGWMWHRLSTALELSPWSLLA